MRSAGQGESQRRDVTPEEAIHTAAVSSPGDFSYVANPNGGTPIGLSENSIMMGDIIFMEQDLSVDSFTGRTPTSSVAMVAEVMGHANLRGLPYRSDDTTESYTSRMKAIGVSVLNIQPDSMGNSPRAFTIAVGGMVSVRQRIDEDLPEGAIVAALPIPLTKTTKDYETWISSIGYKSAHGDGVMSYKAGLVVIDPVMQHVASMSDMAKTYLRMLCPVLTGTSPSTDFNTVFNAFDVTSSEFDYYSATHHRSLVNALVDLHGAMKPGIAQKDWAKNFATVDRARFLLLAAVLHQMKAAHTAETTYPLMFDQVWSLLNNPGWKHAGICLRRFGKVLKGGGNGDMVDIQLLIE